MCKFKIVKTVSLPFLRLPKRSASREKWEGGGGGKHLQTEKNGDGEGTMSLDLVSVILGY